MSATIAATAAPVVLRASDAIMIVRDDGSTVMVTLDVLRAYLLTQPVAAAPAPVPAPHPAESAEGATVTTVGPALTDAAGNTFGINAAMQVVTNGHAEDGQGGRPYTANVVMLAYHLHYLWQKNKAGHWFMRKGLTQPYQQVQ